ncbi:MAG: hypothetical protein ABIM30_01135 [candidate division WOR-3 bacterium]
MANDIRKFVKGVGITPTTSSPINEKGELRVNDADGKLRYHNGTSESAVVTESHAATLTNKTIDGDDNTLQDISLSSLKVEAGDANKVIRRDASGSVISGNDLPNSSPILTTDSTQTITNKTIDGDDNTIQDVALTSLKQEVADADKVIRRDSSGVVISGNDLPNTSPIVTTDATQTLTNKTIDGDDNTVQDLALTSLKTVVADANKVLRRDASGDVISGNNLPNSSPILTTDATQTITNKTIDGDDNTLQDISLSSLKTIAADADKVIRRDSSGAVISGNTLPNSSPIVTTDATQVLTNKDFDGGTASSSRRITLPQDTYANINALTRKEGTILYANDTDKVYIDDGTNLKEIGSGGGELNFLQLSNKAYDAESGTTGWSTYKDTAASRPVDGTGGTPSVVSAISTTTTTPLSGTRSFLLAKGSGNGQGEGWSVDFQIDRAHFARVLQIEFDYQVASGTFVAGNTIDYTTAGDSDLIVYIYDIDNNQLIEPTTIRLYSNSMTIADKFVANFQTSADSINYRLIFHVATTSALAWTLKVDNIVVKPAKYTYGTPIGNWTEYTPTFNSGFTVGTGGYSKWYWRRVGEDCEIRGSFRLGTSGFSMGSGNFTFSIPSGLSIDVTKISGRGYGVNGADFARLGNASLFDDNGSGAREIYEVMRNGTSLNMFLIHGRTDTGSSGMVNSTFPFTWGVDDGIHIYNLSVPIAGWSSSVKIAEPMELRDVHLRLSRPSSFTVTHGTPIQVITWPTGSILADTANTFDATNNAFLAPTSGYYIISGWVIIAGGNANHKSLWVRVLNTNLTIKYDQIVSVQYNNSMDSRFPVSFVVYLNAGERIQICGDGGGFGTSYFQPDIQITRLPSSQALAQSEVVAVRLTTQNSGTLTVPNGTSNPWVPSSAPFVKTLDTHNAYDLSTHTFTAPVSGIYEFSLNFLTDSVSWSAGQFILIGFVNTKTGEIKIARHRIQASITNHINCSTSGVLWNLSAGDTIRLFSETSRGATNLYITNNDHNWISIKKIG